MIYNLLTVLQEQIITKRPGNVKKRLIDSIPTQCASTQHTVCQDIFVEVQNFHVGTSAAPTMKLQAILLWEVSENGIQHCFG